MDRTGNILNTNSPRDTTNAPVPYWESAAANPSKKETPSPTQTLRMESYAATTESKKSHVAPAEKSSVRGSNIGGTLATVLLIVLAVMAGFLVWKKLPRNYSECTSTWGSTAENGRCTTFYNKVFVDWPSNEANTQESTSLDAVLTQTADETPEPEASDETQATTKGGLVIAPTTGAQQATKPAPSATQAPAEGGTWIKHNYPGQHLSLYVPRNYHGSDATRNRDTQITTFKLWTTNNNNPEIAFKLQPASSVSDSDKNKEANTSVAGNPASKSGNTYTWQKNDVFYTVTCTTDAKLCDEIMGKVSIN